MCDGGAGVMELLPFRIGQVNTMSVEAARADEVVMIVNIEVAVALRVKFPNPVNFLLSFGDMGLNIGARIFAP